MVSKAPVCLCCIGWGGSWGSLLEMGGSLGGKATSVHQGGLGWGSLLYPGREAAHPSAVGSD